MNHDEKPGLGLARLTIIVSMAYGIIFAALLIYFILKPPTNKHFPPRDRFRSAYHTVHCWDTVCFECHPKGIRSYSDGPYDVSGE